MQSTETPSCSGILGLPDRSRVPDPGRLQDVGRAGIAPDAKGVWCLFRRFDDDETDDADDADATACCCLLCCKHDDNADDDGRDHADHRDSVVMLMVMLGMVLMPVIMHMPKSD